jgi:hypothetical protein
MVVTTNKLALKRIQSSAEEHPLWLFGGALGAGLLLGKIAPHVVSSLVKLGGGLAWKMFVLPALTEKVAALVEGKADLPKLNRLDKETALGLVGLTTRPSAAGRLLGNLGLLTLGAAAGAGLGLAFAPRPGTELRRELVDKLQKMRHHNGHPTHEIDDQI